MTGPTANRIESRLAELEAETRYGDESIPDLYLKMLKDKSPTFPEEHPGVNTVFMRRYRAEKRRREAIDERRRERYGGDAS